MTSEKKAIVQELLDHGARRLVRARGTDRTWTPMTLATYHGLPDDVRDLLRPTSQDLDGASEEDREWAWGFGGGKRGISYDEAYCDHCLLVRTLATPVAHLPRQAYLIQTINRDAI